MTQLPITQKVQYTQREQILKINPAEQHHNTMPPNKSLHPKSNHTHPLPLSLHNKQTNKINMWKINK